MKKITFGFIIVLISTFSLGLGISSGDSISTGKLTDEGPAISTTQTQEEEFEPSEQASNGSYSCELVNDGSFENQTSAWDEWRSPPDSSRIVDPSSAWSIPVSSYDGTYSWWGGGYTGEQNDEPVSNYVEQEIDIPSGATQLRFQMISYRADQDDLSPEDVFAVLIDGETVFSLDMTQANNSPGCPDACVWEEQTVDISGCTGHTVTLRFYVESGDSDYTGNVLVDYVQVCSPVIRRGLSSIYLLLLGD